ncbi:hypothetical protein KO561_07960 [Radiobacillus kanasensis]|uniref:hypothetical protein n=1 Tax=Radiobacillus kanasensis TaxID=2844358 RepID=UPI001E3E0619|nr:hypothetical protein [Radiobacillus kanasensis]UFU00855.1 hypothetical protein KO561_07960 [Radiobacillus kanasensis]
MGEIIDFEINKTKKLLQAMSWNKGLEYEVFLTVVNFVNKYSNYEQYPDDFLTTESSLCELYKGDSRRFIATFDELLQYWSLDAFTYRPDEMEQFKTVGDLCEFIDLRVSQ